MAGNHWELPRRLLSTLHRAVPEKLRRPIRDAYRRYLCRRTLPLTSIVLVAYNNWEYTNACLTSIFRHTPRGRYEVIVVDNASTDATRDGLYGYQRQRDDVRVIPNERNRGFAAATNQGLRLAEGDLLVLLNNDTLVTPGWLHRFARWLEDPAIGLVGPLTNQIANEACIPTSYSDLAGLPDFAQAIGTQRAGQSFDIAMLAMFCVAMRRNVYEAVGELDERFGIGMFEDDDYSLRVRQAGKRVVCAEDVFIHHFGSVSFGKLPRAEYHAIFEENKARFEQKWSRKWEPHQTRDPGRSAA